MPGYRDERTPELSLVPHSSSLQPDPDIQATTRFGPHIPGKLLQDLCRHRNRNGSGAAEDRTVQSLAQGGLGQRICYQAKTKSPKAYSEHVRLGQGLVCSEPDEKVAPRVPVPFVTPAERNNTKIVLGHLEELRGFPHLMTKSRARA